MPEALDRMCKVISYWQSFLRVGRTSFDWYKGSGRPRTQYVTEYSRFRSAMTQTLRGDSKLICRATCCSPAVHGA